MEDGGGSAINRPVVDEIAELLRERIIHGRYPADAPLSRRRLAEELSVSRPLIGEVLRMLEREGLVTMTPSGRATVRDDRSNLIYAYGVREMVDGLAARLAAGRRAEASDDVLVNSLGAQRDALATENLRRYRQANVAFHTALIESAGNPLLLGQLSLVRATSRSVTILGQARRTKALDEHAEIIAAVRARRPAEAEDAARAHVRATVAALEEAA